MSTFYITTPIYYVNDVPHLGHAYTTIVCDALARFHRMRGDDTRFLTGTDEHGQKVEEAAKKRGLSPQELVDQVAPRFDETWRTLGMDGYRFIRTTSERHKRVVGELWQRIRRENPDDLYLATYQGWYCVGCEAFYTESQLAREGETWICTTHKKPVTWLEKERSWFFRLSKYAGPLLAHIKANPDFIRPESYRKEMVAFLSGDVRDLSVSRTSFAWGIPVPEPDPEGLSHVIYVWMDALTNYLSDLCPEDGQIGGADVERYWPHAIHVIGKDILRFHTVYWPAFLLSAKLPLPKGIFAHGWWTVRGEKISKSMPATRIDPVVLAEALGAGSPLGRAIGIDAMRYFLLREVPLGNDGDFTFESLFERFNADLANDLGNLVNRSLTMITKFAGEFPPARAADPTGPSQVHVATLEKEAAAAVIAAAHQLGLMAPSRALEAIWRFVGAVNAFIDQAKPWAMAKAKDPMLGHVLWALQSSLWVIERLIAPVLPATATALRGWIGDTAELAWPKEASEGAAADVLGQAPALTCGPPSPLFPRLDADAQARIFKQIVGEDAAVAAPPPSTAGAEPPAKGKPGAKGKDAGAKAPSPPKAEAAAGATPATSGAPAASAVSTAGPSAVSTAGPSAVSTAGPSAASAAGPSDATAGASDGGTIKMADFARVELRTGRVLSAVAVPKAKKLLHLSVDLGEPQPRSIVAGIAEAYAPEQLVGKQVIVVANLEPATIRGIRSEGMILAAGEATIAGLSALDQDVPPGTRVR